jgi:hypothetical protein
VEQQDQGANLTAGRGIDTEWAERHAWAFEGATMPNEQKYEDWLKDKEAREEDRENGAPS